MQMQMPCALGLVATLAGCSMASGPLASPPIPANPANAANVTVYRATAPEDDAARMVVTVNGNGVYQLQPGGRYDLVLGPGSYSLGYRMALSKCSVPIQILANGHYVFKLASGCAVVLESQ